MVKDIAIYNNEKNKCNQSLPISEISLVAKVNCHKMYRNSRQNIICGKYGFMANGACYKLYAIVANFNLWQVKICQAI